MNLPTQRKFWSVGVGHFVNDTFMAFTAVLLKFLSDTIMPMSNTQIGLIASAQQWAGALGQPFFGWRADKTGGRGIGGGGLALVIGSFTLTIILAVSTQNYWLIFIPFILQGIGSSMTHPVGGLHSAEADETRVNSNVTYFFLCGQLGLAIGPALIGFLLSSKGVQEAFSQLLTWFGLMLNPVQQTFAPIFVLVLLALPSIWFMWSGIPGFRAARKRSETKAKAVSRREFYMPFVVIVLLVLLRAMASSSVYFVPALYGEMGWSPAEYGVMNSLYALAGAITGVFFGNMADRVDRRMIVLWTMLFATPFFLAMPYVDGIWAYPVAMLAGGFSAGSHSLIVVMAQQLIPNSKGLASGAILGLIFGSGALGSIIIGLLSDNFGLASTFMIIGIVGAVSGFVALLLPKPKLEMETV
jgi:FSR family fosmidomycin resistance protein-like MFS transporter